MEQLPLALRVIRVIAVVAIIVSESVVSGCVLNLIVAIPNLHGHEPAPSWERGEEMLCGAQIAIDEMKNKSECQLELIEVDNGLCGTANNFNLLQQSFAQFVNDSLKFIGVVGLTCSDEFSFVIPSLSSGTSFRKVTTLTTNLASPVATLDRKSLLIRALFRFMKKLNWQKLGVITENENTYFSHIAEILYREAKYDPNIDIISYQQLQVQTNSRVTVIHRPIQIMSKITFVSVNLQITVAILCSAYQNKLLWPDYVLILHGYLGEDIVNVTVYATCNVTEVLENVLFIREQKTLDVFGSTYEDFHMQYCSKSFQNGHKVNPYSIILHSLVMSTLLRLFNSSAPINESMSQHRIIEITQYHNRKDIPISFVHENGNVSVIDDNQITKIATVSDDFEIRFEGASIGYTVIIFNSDNCWFCVCDHHVDWLHLLS